MQNFIESKKKKGVVIGVSEGNIGSEILTYLNARNHDFAADWEGSHADMDTLILCNGYSDLGWIGETVETSKQRMLHNNFDASICYIDRFVQATVGDRRVKRIIIIGSMAYNSVLNGSSIYCASKAAINQYAKCAAYELAKNGYLVTVINPGNVLDTPMTAKVKAQLTKLHNISPPEAEAYWGKVNNLGEFVTKKDIAKMVKFLLKPEARFLSGSSLDLRGSNR